VEKPVSLLFSERGGVLQQYWRFRMGLSRGLIIAPKVVMVVLAAVTLVFTGCVPENSPSPGPGKSQQATAPALKPAEPSAASAKPLSSSLAAAPPARPQVQAVIDAAETAYQNGVTDYHAGKLQTAKADFDRAVDLMLTSNLDLKNEPQLRDEFDRILDAVNTLEMEALKQGNGFAPKLEPAPVDIANDVTFPVDPTVKAQAIAELKTTQSDLPLVINDPVAGYISYFSSRGRGTLTRSLERAGRYRAMIATVLAEEGVPQDLVYQAVAESGFQPQAVNGRSGAGGMWQFMPSSIYGLNRNGWFDERFDPEKSTHAYARYMKLLYAQLGDWYLAMAAYDWGPANVQHAVQRTGYADFWELYRRNALPQETKNYVPIIIAAAIMAKNPEQYGLQSLAPEPPVLADSVTTDYGVDLRLVSDLVEAPVQEISALNPSLLRMSTPTDAPFELHLPAGSKDLYQKRISEIPVDKRNQWRFHKVVAGESLQTIARDYHVSPSEIVFVNQLEPGDNLSATDSLIIPVPPAASSKSGRLTLYRVEHGDTLVTVADRFNVTVQQLRRWNHLVANRLEPGRRLYVAEPARVSGSRHTGNSSDATHGSKLAHSAPSHKPTAHASAGTHTTAKSGSSSTSHHTAENAALNR
jgi:membrane-bound lytic murein transglycosylase D